MMMPMPASPTSKTLTDIDCLVNSLNDGQFFFWQTFIHYSISKNSYEINSQEFYCIYSLITGAIHFGMNHRKPNDFSKENQEKVELLCTIAKRARGFNLHDCISPTLN